jgi:hypothetical protein
MRHVVPFFSVRLGAFGNFGSASAVCLAFHPTLPAAAALQQSSFLDLLQIAPLKRSHRVRLLLLRCRRLEPQTESSGPPGGPDLRLRFQDSLERMGRRC